MNFFIGVDRSCCADIAVSQVEDQSLLGSVKKPIHQIPDRQATQTFAAQYGLIFE
jgi:hypothetical protein